MTAGNSEQSVAPDEARIHVAVGREATISPDLRAALDMLAKALEQNEDVQGYMEDMHCGSVGWAPCGWLFTCGRVS